MFQPLQQYFSNSPMHDTFGLMPFAVPSLKGQSCQSIGLFNVCLSCMSICHSCACWQSQWAPYQLPLCPLAWDLLRLSFPNESRLWCFSIPRGWRLTCHTGWTKHAPVTKGVSITMMKTPPLAHVTPVLTDTERMSTTTTIKSSRTQTTGRCLCERSKGFVLFI